MIHCSDRFGEELISRLLVYFIYHFFIFIIMECIKILRRSKRLMARNIGARSTIKKRPSIWGKSNGKRSRIGLVKLTIGGHHSRDTKKAREPPTPPAKTRTPALKKQVRHRPPTPHPSSSKRKSVSNACAKEKSTLPDVVPQRMTTAPVAMRKAATQEISDVARKIADYQRGNSAVPSVDTLIGDYPFRPRTLK